MNKKEAKILGITIIVSFGASVVLISLVTNDDFQPDKDICLEWNKENVDIPDEVGNSWICSNIEFNYNKPEEYINWDEDFVEGAKACCLKWT